LAIGGIWRNFASKTGMVRNEHRTHKKNTEAFAQMLPGKNKKHRNPAPYFVNFDLLSKAFFICEFRVQDTDLRQHKN
jgi:hypothetical protein